MKKLFKDLAFNALYQVFLIILPLLTTPILSRRIGSEGLGIYGIVFSIAQFLMVFIAVGMNPYRIRRIAKARNNNDLLNEEFWNIFLVQFLMGISTIIVYTVAVIKIGGPYLDLYLIQTLFILGITLDIVWFFQGIEEFSKVVLRNTLIKVFSVLLIILFVRNKNDLFLYVFITSVINLLGSLIFWVNLKNKIGKPAFNKKLFKSLWCPGFGILIPQLVMQVYTTLDKSVVGYLTTPTEVSYYDQSQKIARIVLAILSSVTVVMLPKMTRSISEGNYQQVIKYTQKTFLYTLVTATVFCNIVMANTAQFVVWFFGSEFAPMSINMFLISLIIIFSPLGGIFANQFALAMEKDRAYALPIFIGAIISLVGNFLIVPHWKSIGATVVLIVVEFTVMVCRIFVVRKDLNLKEIFRPSVLKFLLLSILIIFLTSNYLPNFIPNIFLNMVLKSVMIGSIYLVLIYFLLPDISQDMKAILIKMKR